MAALLFANVAAATGLLTTEAAASVDTLIGLSISDKRRSCIPTNVRHVVKNFCDLLLLLDDDFGLIFFFIFPDDLGPGRMVGEWDSGPPPVKGEDGED